MNRQNEQSHEYNKFRSLARIEPELSQTFPTSGSQYPFPHKDREPQPFEQDFLTVSLTLTKAVELVAGGSPDERCDPPQESEFAMKGSVTPLSQSLLSPVMLPPPSTLPSKALSLCESGDVGSKTCFIRVLIQPAASLSLQFVLYGAYAVLYGICMSILHNRKLPHHYIHVTAATSLFAMATISLFFSTVIIVHTAKLSLVGLTFVHGDSVITNTIDQQAWLIPSAHLVLVVANSIADGVLVWRCSTIWAYNKKAVAFPAVFCFLNNLLGIVTGGLYIANNRQEQFFQIPHTDITSTLFTVFIFGTMFSNLLITAMIAGRIFYLGHKTKAFLVPDYQRMYKTAISITLESGMLLPFAIIIYACATLNSQIENVSGPHPEMAPEDRFEVMETMAEVMFYALVQFVGIAPTLIIVRIGLGVSVEDAHQKTQTASLLPGPGFGPEQEMRQMHPRLD